MSEQYYQIQIQSRTTTFDDDGHIDGVTGWHPIQSYTLPLDRDFRNILSDYLLMSSKADQNKNVTAGRIEYRLVRVLVTVAEVFNEDTRIMNFADIKK